MPEVSEYTHGTPSWIDLSTTDPEAAKAFYGTVFGWEFTEEPAGDRGVYIMATKDGKNQAGMMQQAPEQAQMGLPPMWNTYVTVDDIDAALAKTESAGGQVMAPTMDVMDAGQMAVIVDPTGAAVCLWKAKEHIGAQVVNEHGALCWNELVTPDVATAVTFYGEVFGWTPEEMDMGADGPSYTVFQVGENGVSGALNPPTPEIPAHWGTVFAVDDADAAAAAITDAGGKVMQEPFDTPVGRIVVAADPTGAAFQAIQLTPES